MRLDLEVVPVTLRGQVVCLEPLAPGHADGLGELAEPEIFAYMPTRPIEPTRDALRSYIDAGLEAPNRLAFAIILNETGRAVGTSSYLNIRARDRGLEIGATWVGRPFQGTLVNPESKYLMLQHAFETLGAVRVELRCDRRNRQSQRAIEKLGATRDGVLRKHMVMPDGYMRDTVVYSIIEDDWPLVRSSLEVRLGRHAGTERDEV